MTNKHTSDDEAKYLERYLSIGGYKLLLDKKYQGTKGGKNRATKETILRFNTSQSQVAKGVALYNMDLFVHKLIREGYITCEYAYIINAALRNRSVADRYDFYQYLKSKYKAMRSKKLVIEELNKYLNKDKQEPKETATMTIGVSNYGFFNGYMINRKEICNAYIAEETSPEGVLFKWLRINFLNTNYVRIPLTQEQHNYHIERIYSIIMGGE